MLVSSGKRPSNMMAKWFNASFQCRTGIVHRLRRLANRHVNQLQGRVLVGVNLPIPRELANHAVDRLDRVGRVDRLADRRRIVEQRDDVRPLHPPHLADRRILRVPGLSKLLQRLLGLDHRRRRIDLLQVARHRLAVLVAHVTQRGANQMHDAQLHARLRVGRVDRLREAGQPVDARHEDVAQPAILQIGQAREPELGPFALGQPQPEQFLVTLQIHANRHVNRVLRDAAVGPADMHHQAVEVDDRPHRIDRPRPPGADFGVQVGGDFRDQRGRDLHAVQLLHDLLDVAGRHPLGVQGEDLLVEARHPPLVLLDQLRLEGAVAVPRRGDRQVAGLAADRLLRSAVATVRRLPGRLWLDRGQLGRSRCGRRRLARRFRQRAASEMHVHLGIEHPLQGRLHHQPHQPVHILDRPGLAGNLAC